MNCDELCLVLEIQCILKTDVQFQISSLNLGDIHTFTQHLKRVIGVINISYIMVDSQNKFISL
jgi:hypothetical protein